MKVQSIHFAVPNNIPMASLNKKCSNPANNSKSESFANMPAASALANINKVNFTGMKFPQGWELVKMEKNCSPQYLNDTMGLFFLEMEKVLRVKARAEKLYADFKGLASIENAIRYNDKCVYQLPPTKNDYIRKSFFVDNNDKLAKYIEVNTNNNTFLKEYVYKDGKPILASAGKSTVDRFYEYQINDEGTEKIFIMNTPFHDFKRYITIDEKGRKSDKLFIRSHVNGNIAMRRKVE